jgi:hypothetical protein
LKVLAIGSQFSVKFPSIFRGKKRLFSPNRALLRDLLSKVNESVRGNVFRQRFTQSRLDHSLGGRRRISVFVLQSRTDFYFNSAEGLPFHMAAEGLIEFAALSTSEFVGSASFS